MSFADPSAEPVQPEGGQGGEGTSDAPYAEYLNRIPEEVRGDVEPIFREWDANTTKRFQEQADFRKSWEPYDQAGISQYPAETVAWALQTLQNPEQARAWLDQTYGQAQAQQQAQQQAEPVEDPYGFVDPAQQQFEQLLEQKLGPLQQQLQQYEQRWEQLEQQAHEQQIAEQIDREVADLKTKHGESLPPELRDQFDQVISRFSMQYAEPGADPKQVVARGWQDFQSYMNAIEKSVLQSKVDAPKPAEGGGVPDVTPPQFKSIMDGGLQNAAVEFLRNSNRM